MLIYDEGINRFPISDVLMYRHDYQLAKCEFDNGLVMWVPTTRLMVVA